MYHEIVIGGVGGQGIMVLGNLLAQAAFKENLNVTYIPIYGVERLVLPSLARRNPASS
jgi:2-oxoglutarate ferredoxin oxidoreductase subunit gamma